MKKLSILKFADGSEVATKGDIQHEMKFFQENCYFEDNKTLQSLKDFKNKGDIYRQEEYHKLISGEKDVFFSCSYIYRDSEKRRADGLFFVVIEKNTDNKNYTFISFEVNNDILRQTKRTISDLMQNYFLFLLEKGLNPEKAARYASSIQTTIENQSDMLKFVEDNIGESK